MSYIVKTSLLPEGHRLRVGGNYTKNSITIHSTGNLSSNAQGERNWLNNPTNNRQAAWHYVVEEGFVIQAIPDNEEAWHCGDSYGNKHSIGIEIVESGNRSKVLMTAAEFTADLLRHYGMPISALKCHFDWTGKNCPRILIDDGFIRGSMNWQWFVRTVEAFLEDDEMIEKAKVIVDGKEYEALRILKEGSNFLKARDMAGVLGYDISSQGSVPVFTSRKTGAVTMEELIQLRDLANALIEKIKRAGE